MGPSSIVSSSCKIAIFRALQLGDLLCSIPAIRSLKSFVPKAEIWLIGLPGADSFTQRFKHYFAGFIQFPGFPGLPEQDYNVKEIARFITFMQEQRFDLILQMQGNGTKVNQMIELLGAKNCGGFYMPSDYKPPGELFIPYPDFGHEIERHLALMRHLGASDNSVALEFPISDKDMEAFSKIKLDLGEDFICIHPGSRGTWRQWPRENFARIADLCIENNFEAVITGTADEMDIVNDVVQKMKHRPVIAAGKTNLGAMGVLLSKSHALVSNCTGVSHMASALGVPGVIISMDGEPHRWGPLDTSHFYTINWLTDPDFSKAEAALFTILKQGIFTNPEFTDY